ncbi:CU044_5270 family protein [Dactylosporangium sp. NPDC049742]|uniref:CU044_5270 family protein n=1 Tax=Dactylosporangium sp. NPDC049742 TaxID=3154737 RepID=UPI00343B57F0
MNDLQPLRDFRSEVPEMADVTGAERAFVTAMRTAAPRPRSHRPLIFAAGLATAAAAVAVAVMMTSAPTPAPRVAGGSPATPATGSSAPQAVKIKPVSVAELLDLAAAAPGAINPGPGQFVVTESLMSDMAELGEGGRFLYAMKVTTWVASDNSKPGVSRTEQLEPRPYPGQPLPANLPKAGSVDVRVLCPVKGDVTRQDYAYYATLPTDAQGMLKVFARFPGGGADKNHYLWKAGIELAAAPMPAAQHAAVFQALKLIPGAVLVGDAQDTAGRTGTAVGRVGPDGWRRDLIFDPVTFAFLGSRTVNETGAQVGGTAQLSVTVADAAPPAQPGPKQEGC